MAALFIKALLEHRTDLGLRAGTGGLIDKQEQTNLLITTLVNGKTSIEEN